MHFNVSGLILFVAAVGLGPFPGVLAIAIHSIGMLGKLFSEACESAVGGVWQAMVKYVFGYEAAMSTCSIAAFQLK